MARSKVVFFGTIISQIVTFATSFVITVYYNPEDLGFLGTLSALISIIAGTLSFRLDLAIIQSPKEDAPTVFAQTTAFSLLVSTLFCLLCFVLPWNFSQRITEFFWTFLLWCWGYIILFNSLQLPYRFDELKKTSQGAISRSLFIFAFLFLGGWLNPTLKWLLSVRVLGDYFGAIFHLRGFFRLINWKRAFSGWRAFLVKHKEYLFYITPHHLCLALSNNIIIFFLDESFGLRMVGFFVLAQRLIQAPVELVGTTLFNVTIQRFSELRNHPKDLRDFYIKIVLFSFVTSTAIGLVIFVSIDYFIPILGTKWLQASTMVKSLIPYFMSILFVTPTTNFLRFIERARLQLVIELIEVIVKIGFLMLLTFASSNEMILQYSLLVFSLSVLKTLLVFKLIPLQARPYT
jgi:O-antigen/teichoic acid export membrane protein